MEAWDYGCNPGGEVLGQRLPDVPLHSLPRRLTHRLITDPGEITDAEIAVENATTKTSAEKGSHN